MSDIIPSIVRRYLKSSKAFTVNTGETGPPWADVSPNERIIGWYRNPDPFADECVVFTSEAIYFGAPPQLTRLAIRDISDYEVPHDKQNVTGVRVRTADGFRFIRIAGRGEGSIRDAFALVMIVRAFLQVLKNKSP